MRALVETAAFGGLALALHVAVWSGLPGGSGPAAGDGGRDAASLSGGPAAAPAALAELVAAWDRPPELAPPATLAALTPPQPDVPALPTPPVPPSEMHVPSRPEDGSTRSDTVPAPLLPPVPPLPTAPAAPPELGMPAEPPTAAPAADPPSPGAMAVAPLPPAPAEAPPSPHAPPPPPVAVAEAGPDAPRPEAQPDRAAAPDPPAAPAAQARQSPAPLGQRAAGAGGGAAQGQVAAPGLSEAGRQRLMADWGGRIRARIMRAAPRASGRGTVTVQLTVGRDGGLQAVTVSRSSGNPALDRAALAAVRAAGRLPPAPAGLDGAAHAFTLPLRFD